MISFARKQRNPAKTAQRIEYLLAAHGRKVEVILYHRSEVQADPDTYFVLYRGANIEHDPSIRARSAVVDFEIQRYVDIEQFSLDTITRDRQALIDELIEIKGASIIYGSV